LPPGAVVHKHAPVRPTLWRAVGALALATGGLTVAASAAPAVETDIAISTNSIDFGEVNVGSSAQSAVTLTNTGGDPFGPINMFGGAPPTNEFNASQNCQGSTLPAGGSCQVNYSFAPGATGAFNDSSNFTVSETMSQSDGEDFAVALTGKGCEPNSNCTTTTTTAAPTTTVAATTTLAPTTPTNSPPNSVPGGNTATTLAPVKELEVDVERDKVAPGQDETARAKGFEPNEAVTGTVQPNGRVVGTQTADDTGEVVFTFIVAEADGLGPHEFVASGATSGAVATSFEIVATAAEADDDSSGTSPWLIGLIVVVVLALIVGAVLFAYKRGRAANDDTSVDGDRSPTPDTEPPPDPESPTQPVPKI
jgi:hypothetical protein